ncbi:MAG TPA: hypothetical protein IAC46_01575 [Candidatus Onthoplasma faecigallinarum]|nr:hypothetical protein [Candidatus Onthoplasma faecigallinarum]
MIKWILIVVLIAVIMLIAYSVSEQYKDRYDFYNNLKMFLNQFKINISFRQEKINNFLNSITPKKQFKCFIEEYKKYLSTGELNLDNVKVLEDEDKVILNDIVKNIGKYDAKNEVQQLDTFLLTVDTRLSKALEDKNKLCPMIIKLALLFAIGLSILLI